MPETPSTIGQGLTVEKTITVNRRPEEVYRFWRNVENLPRFMSHLKSVTVVDQKRSHWVAAAPLGASVEWDAEITADQENAWIAWTSLPGADVANSGHVRFEEAPDRRGTVVTVCLVYDPPAGALGASMAKLFGREPGQQVDDDLRHFKHMMEADEMPTAQNQPSGREATADPATIEDKLAHKDQATHGYDPDSIVTEASEESFPASDPPAWTLRRDESVLG